jgi:hypothetical protein
MANNANEDGFLPVLTPNSVSCQLHPVVCKSHHVIIPMETRVQPKDENCRVQIDLQSTQYILHADAGISCELPEMDMKMISDFLVQMCEDLDVA